MKNFNSWLNENISSKIEYDINQVLYGNPPIEYIEIIQRPDDHIKEWFINQGLVNTIKANAPTNDSGITKADLQSLIEKTSKATAEEIQFARYVESVDNLAQSFIDILKENNIEITMGDFFRIDSQSEGILHFLKNEINRPRPYQLAKYYDLPIFPLIRTDAMSAAYPSGHALTGFVMGEYFANKYTNIAMQLRAHGERIANSRELTGIHYPSDTQISREICKIIIENNLIQD